MTKRSWQGLVFIGISVDGKVARPDGSLDWLEQRGALAGDAGYTEFTDRVDAILLGRATYEVIAGFPEWPYPGQQVFVLSTTLSEGVDERVRLVRSLAEASSMLNECGASGVYIDGAHTIQSCLRAGLIDEITLSQIAVILGTGIPLFDRLGGDIALTHAATRVLGGGMVQSRYLVPGAAE